MRSVHAMLITTAACLVASCFAPTMAFAQCEPNCSASGQFSDDFNRPSGTDLGPNWVERAGNMWIVSDSIVRSGDNTRPSLMTVSGFNTSAPQLTLDVSYPSFSADFAYAALIGRYADANNSVYVKVQNTLSPAPPSGLPSSAFDGLFFYYGTDGGGWAGMTGGAAFQPIEPFRDGRLGLTVVGSDVTATIDTNFDGTPELTYTRGGLPWANLGTEVGMAIFQVDVAVNTDNFTAADGELIVP